MQLMAFLLLYISVSPFVMIFDNSIIGNPIISISQKNCLSIASYTNCSHCLICALISLTPEASPCYLILPHISGKVRDITSADCIGNPQVNLLSISKKSVATHPKVNCYRFYSFSSAPILKLESEENIAVKPVRERTYAFISIITNTIFHLSFF